MSGHLISSILAVQERVIEDFSSKTDTITHENVIRKPGNVTDNGNTVTNEEGVVSIEGSIATVGKENVTEGWESAAESLNAVPNNLDSLSQPINSQTGRKQINALCGERDYPSVICPILNWKRACPKQPLRAGAS